MKPADKINIGYNKTNDEYLGYLEEKNKLVKDQQKSREYQEKRKKEEREKGFNVFISGANEDRINEQRKKEILKDNQRQMDAKGVRRQWRNPSQNDRDNSQGNDGSGSRGGAHPKYHNPFELNPYDSKPSSKHGVQNIGGKSPPKIRKRWGQAQEFSQAGQPLKAIQRDEDEDEYSDSFEDPYQDDVEEDEMPEDVHQQSEEQKEIEQFLRTGTREEINELRMSLSNFRNFKMQQQQVTKQQEDEYIEEDFEEDIPEATDDDSEEERKQYEEVKRQQQSVVQTSRVVTKPGGKIRPISATFNLAQQKVGVQTTRNADTGSQYISNVASTSNLQPKLQPSVQSVQQQQQYSSNLSQMIQETPKQPNDMMKKPINTNPFKRPFSQNVPKRMTNEVSASAVQSQNKTSEQAFQQQPRGLNLLMQKLENLDETQIEHLLEVLNNLETGSSLTNSQMASQLPSVQAQIQQISQQPPQQKLDLDFLSPSKKLSSDKQPSAVQSKVSTLDKTRNELVIRVKSTYGNPHLCGLTEIELFDEQCKKVNLLPASIFSRNMGQGPKISLEKLTNGQKLTNDDRQMWIGYLPQPPQHLEILMYYNKEISLGALKIWNYNKSIVDCTKGAKDVQVLINNELVWEGILNSGKGQTDVDYGTSIILKEGLVIPPAIQPKSQNQIVEEAIYEDDEEDEETKQSDQQEEQLRKYRSEAVMKKRPDSTPFWLQEQKRVMAERPGQSQQSQRKEGTRAAQETVNLLDKYSTNKDSTTVGDTSSNKSAYVSQRSSEFRDQKSTSNLIKPNAGMGGLQAQKQSKPFDIPQEKNKQWTQPFSVQKQREETNQAIQNAVNKVNQVVNSQPPSKRPRNAKLVEESLDSLDFFKVTNLGRLQNDQEQVTQEKTSEKRAKWRSSPAKGGLQDSTISSGKHKGAHVIVKNPFPEQTQSHHTKNTPSTQRKQQVKFEAQDDILDQWMNMGSKGKTNRDPIESLNVPIHPKSGPQKEHQSSLSPARQEQPYAKQSSQLSAKSETYEDRLRQFQESFIIPNLPAGTRLEFNILSTWGDMNYVGLTGIELFDIEGNKIKIDEANISACPPDINILPGYGSDPRTIDKLIDDHLFTNDDLHVWLTPFTAGEDHTITLDLVKKHQISMIRIWNYNKSRIHSYRGARFITCQLDGKIIFRGEIQKAPGNLNNPEDCCEILLFTDNNTILQRIDNSDWLNDKCIVSDMEDTQRIMEMPSYLEDRPMTATKKFSTAEIQDIQRHMMQQKPQSLFDERPTTSAIITGDQEERKFQDKRNSSSQFTAPPNIGQQQQQSNLRSTGVRGRVVEMNILESWGDLFYVGLNGLEVLDERGHPIHITMNMVEANPRDMNSIPGHGSDHRTLDKLFNRQNNTTDDHHMWLIPYNKGENHTLKIDFGRVIAISGIKFYNYNKSEEDTLRGVKQITISIDSKFVTPKKGITLRKAPGLVHELFDMGQIVNLPFKQGWTTDQIIPMQRKPQPIGLFQEYEAVNLPMGFIFRFNLYSTHGDFFYIGLNGIELFDQNGNIIVPDAIFAEPQGVHKLPGMESDMRKVGNLVSTKNQTFDEQYMWLAPFKNTRSYAAAGGKENIGESRIPNYVILAFNQPQALSGMRIWNYSKTASRGVNEFELLIDDKQTFRGFVKMAPERQEWEKAFNKDFSTTVLFTSEAKIVDRFKSNVNYDPSKQQTVGLVNEKKVMSKVQAPRTNEVQVFNEMQRPQTMVRRN